MRCITSETRGIAHFQQSEIEKIKRAIISSSIHDGLTAGSVQTQRSALKPN
jgi:hypothetical protein